MVDLDALASRLADADDLTAAAEHLAAHLLEHVPGGAVRVYLLGPGDRCGTCLRARGCRTRDRFLHLVGGLGPFARPPGSVDRIPRTAPAVPPAVARRPPPAPGGVPARWGAPPGGGKRGARAWWGAWTWRGRRGGSG